MILKVLHLNIEKDNHLEEVKKLLKEKNPDIVCFQEAFLPDVENIAREFNYEFAFSPRVIVDSQNFLKKEGSVIFSKYKINEIKIERYDEKISKELPVYTIEETKTKNGIRPPGRFLEHYAILSVSINYDNKKITIATTHFPVVDHIIPGLAEHHLGSMENIREIVRARKHLQRMIHIIRKLSNPIIFTSDLNNTRGEFFYDKVAGELVDIVPKEITSTIDPKLHRKPELQLVVDTIMTSHEIVVENFEIVEGVSDHKALFAVLKI